MFTLLVFQRVSTSRPLTNGLILKGKKLMKPTLPAIKRIIRKAHPNLTGLTVSWGKRPFWLYEPEKAPFKGWWSLVKIEADGFAPTVKPASVGESGGGRLHIGH